MRQMPISHPRHKDFEENRVVLIKRHFFQPPTPQYIVSLNCSVTFRRKRDKLTYINQGHKVLSVLKPVSIMYQINSVRVSKRLYKETVGKKPVIFPSRWVNGLMKRNIMYDNRLVSSFLGVLILFCGFYVLCYGLWKSFTFFFFILYNIGLVRSGEIM